MPNTAELVERTRRLSNPRCQFFINCPICADDGTQIGEVADLLNWETFNVDVQGVASAIRPLRSSLTDSNTLCLASIDLQSGIGAVFTQCKKLKTGIEAKESTKSSMELCAQYAKLKKQSDKKVRPHQYKLLGGEFYTQKLTKPPFKNHELLTINNL